MELDCADAWGEDVRRVGWSRYPFGKAVPRHEDNISGLRVFAPSLTGI